MGRVDRKEKGGGRGGGDDNGEGAEMGRGKEERGGDGEAEKVGWLMLFNDTWSR